jgi:hypothetical protein
MSILLASIFYYIEYYMIKSAKYNIILLKTRKFCFFWFSTLISMHSISPGSGFRMAGVINEEVSQSIDRVVV